MEYTEIELGRFIVVGVSVRTINKDGQALKDIGNLFNRFFSEQIIATIPNKLSEDVYCIYTDYESDFQGAYTTIIGCKVSDAKNLSEGLISKEIPKCVYREYSARGEIHECVGKIWTHIWDSSDIDRAYLADFDVYGEEARNPNDAKVKTYLSVKKEHICR